MAIFGSKQPKQANIKLEMEVKGTARLNKLSNPVAQTSDFQYNQAPNPDFLTTREPYGTTDPYDGYELHEYPADQGGLPDGFYAWNVGSTSSYDGRPAFIIWRDLNYKAPGIVVTTEGMTARPGERWTGTFQQQYEEAWILANSAPSQWKAHLAAFNGNTYLSDVATVTFTTTESWGDWSWVTIASTALTPANTTNVRLRFTDITGSNQPSLVVTRLDIRREFVTVPGWTATNMEVTPRVATWGYGPTVFEAKPTTTTGQVVRSGAVPITAGTQFAGGATDFVSATNATLRVGLEFLNASNAVVSTVWSNTITGQTFKQRVGTAAVAPTGATQVRLILDPQDNKVFQWDAAVLVNDATTLASAQQTGFKETSGFAVTNKIINPGVTTNTLNGWTPAAGTTLVWENGIRMDFDAILDEDQRVAPTVPLIMTSNVFDVAAGNFVSGQATLKGQGLARFRWKWMSATNVLISYSEWSASIYFENDNKVGFAETLQVPANVFRASLEIEFGRAVAMMNGPFDMYEDSWYQDYRDKFIISDVRALVGETMGGVTGTPNSETVTWLNMFNQSTSIKIRRGELDPGVLTAVIADSTLDPNVNISVRPDARVRCMVLKNDNVTWAPIFTGELRDIQVTYPYKKRARITLEAIDNVRTLGNEYVNFGVPTLGALTHVMTGSDVPWTINSADATTNTKVNGETTTRLDQIILTRDTQKGFAFVDKTNRLIIRDRATQVARATTVYFSDVQYTGDAKWNSYTPNGVEVKNSATDVINAMVVTVLTWSGTATVKTESALFTNGTSINEWGRQQKDVTINGGTGAPTATTWATDVMNMHASPVPTVNKLSFPVYDTRSWDHAIDLELYDNVQVEYSPIQLNRTYAVRELVHEITPGKWTCDVSFRSGSGLATLLEVKL